MAKLSLGGVKQMIWTTSSFVVPTAIVFLGFLTFFLYPRTYTPSSPINGCVAGEPPGNNPEVLRNLPAVKNMTDPPRLNQDPDSRIGGPDPVETTDYVLIRQKVPISEHGNTPGWKLLGGQSRAGNTHTYNADNLPNKPKAGYSLYYPAEWGEMDVIGKGTLYIRMLGLILLVNNDPSTVVYGDGLPIYLADVYQDVRMYNLPNKPYRVEELFVCKQSKINFKDTVVIPDQSPSSTNEQLQLEWFAFQKSGIWALHCKPAVYLYPRQRMMVNVKVFPKGELSYTDPPYPQSGWTVNAYPDGTLTTTHNLPPTTYPYLYYESKILDSEIKKPTTGWVVRQSEMEELFNRVLPQLGLNAKEQADFEAYWLSKLPVSPYYFVGLMDKNQRDYLEALDVTPTPDTSIRFSFYFEPLSEYRNVPTPLITTPQRTGFTLVDWGGMIKLHPGTPFTCSQ